MEKYWMLAVCRYHSYLTLGSGASDDMSLKRREEREREMERCSRLAVCRYHSYLTLGSGAGDDVSEVVGQPLRTEHHRVLQDRILRR